MTGREGWGLLLNLVGGGFAHDVGVRVFAANAAKSIAMTQ
jgi:hypothetical protein